MGFDVIVCDRYASPGITHPVAYKPLLQSSRFAERHPKHQASQCVHFHFRLQGL